MKYLIRCYFSTDDDYVLNVERLKTEIEFIKLIYKDTLETMVMTHVDEDYIFEYDTKNPSVARDILCVLSTCFIVPYNHNILVKYLFELANGAAEMIFNNDKQYYKETIGGNYEGTYIEVIKKDGDENGY